MDARRTGETRADGPRGESASQSGIGSRDGSDSHGGSGSQGGKGGGGPGAVRVVSAAERRAALAAVAGRLRCPVCAGAVRLDSGQPDRNQPDSDQLGGNQPNRGQPGRDQPGRGQPSRDQPDRDRPSRDQPDGGQPGSGQPDGDRPSRDQPDRDQPSRGQPGRSQPGRGQPGRGQLVCGRGHRFDIARQGYVNLVAGRPGPGTGDTAEMVAAREDFLARGHYRPIADAIASLAARHVAPGVPASDSPPRRAAEGHAPEAHAPEGRAREGRAPEGHAPDGDGFDGHGFDRADPDGDGLVVDLAGGTGYYLAFVLDSLAGRHGVCLDLSAPALRRAARAHARAAAVGADAWGALPLADGSAALLLSVFGPRNAAEISRVLAPGGTLIIATPGTDHLGELRGPLGLIGIDDEKSRRIADAFGGYEPAGGADGSDGGDSAHGSDRGDGADVRYGMRLGHDDIAALVGMGPNARHIGPETLAARVRALPAPVTVTADVRIRALRRSP